MLCEHSIVWNKTFHRNNKYETKTGNNGAKKELTKVEHVGVEKGIAADQVLLL